MWILKYWENDNAEEKTVGVFPSEDMVAFVAMSIMKDKDYGGGRVGGVTFLIGNNGEQVAYYKA